MVRRKVHPEMRTTYLLKSGQTLENIKASERTRALIVTNDIFQRFVNYTTEKNRIAAQQEEEAERIIALKKATYEKSKTWGSKIENIKAKQRAELLSKRQKAEEERKIFVKEITLKKTTERAEIVQKARKLLLQKSPLCRGINRALFASECLRELDAQVAFQKTIKAMNEEQDAAYINLIKTNIAEHEEQERREIEERTNKTRNYKIELQKQIEEKERNNKLKAAEELQAEKQNQRDMTQYLQFMREKEMNDILSKKKKLQQVFKQAIEEKKQFELELKRNEEFEDRALEICRKSKDRIQDIHKSITLKEKEEKARQIQIIADRCDSLLMEQTREAKEQELFKKAVEEKEAIETEKRKTQKEREETMRVLMKKYKLHDATVKMKQKQEEETLKAWEMIQRFKKNEYDQQINLEERKRQWQQKLEYGKELRKDMEEKEIEKTREMILETKAASMKDAIDRANRKILFYGDEVLEESKDVRPLYPIIKAIEECKKEMGLSSARKIEESVRAERPKRKRGVRRGVCTKPVPVEHVYYFQ